jgi:protein-disulfide isomerase
MYQRRAVLGATAAGIAGLAGCSGVTGGSGSATDTDTAATGTGGESGGEHPALTDIGTQPALGPDPAGGGALVVAFEDPSCSLCRRFEQNTLPQLRSELVDPGELSFVYRGYPVVYEWGKPATQALESAFAADEAAFWALKDHYYAEQGSFTTDNVLDATERFLSEATDVDAAAVVEDARNQVHDAAVRADVDAGEAAGAGGQTPVFYLFRDGEFRTRVSGPQGYDVFAAALGF